MASLISLALGAILWGAFLLPAETVLRLLPEGGGDMRGIGYLMGLGALALVGAGFGAAGFVKRPAVSVLALLLHLGLVGTVLVQTGIVRI